MPAPSRFGSAGTRSAGQELGGRGRGSIVGTLIGVGWMAYGLIWFPNIVRILLALLAATIVVPLLLGSARLIAASRTMPAPNAEQTSASRRVWTLFWVNFAVEIVLLNIAINLLRAPSLRIYWIPAISFVVGLHFLPMARIFAVSSYWITGSAMIGVAVVMVLAMHFPAVSPSAAAAAEALVNSLILWLTAAQALRTNTREP
jgi:hypothetical protein